MIRFKFVGFGVAVFNAWSLFAPTAAWSAKSISDAVVNRVVIDPSDSNTLYAATEIGVFKSTDAAQTWFAINNGLPTLATQVVTLDPGDPNTIYVGLFSGIFKSANGGETWEPTGDLSALYNVHDVAVDPGDSDTIYAGGDGPVVYNKSTNGGRDWLAGIPAGDGHALSIAIDPLNTSTVYMAVFRFFLPPGGLIKTTDGGDTWVRAETGLPGTYSNSVALDPGDSNILYLSLVNDRVYKSITGGDVWFPTALIDPFMSGYGLAIDPNDSNTVFVGTYTPRERGRVFKSTDGGDSWHEANAGIGQNTTLSLAVDPRDRNTTYAGTSVGVFKSTDGGDCWFPTGQ